MSLIRIGRITSSDRASAGVYADASGPEIERVIGTLFVDYQVEWHRVLLPDEQPQLQAALIQLSDQQCCHLIVTTGGTGPARRDVMPEATLAVLEKELPGFGEIMRTQTYAVAPTSILSRGTAGVRGGCLIVNLPGKPSAIAECLTVLGPAILKALDILTLENVK
jgi:molybdopterin adenylyltransferase